MQVITMAAGLGSRLGEMTSECPKALIEVAGRTLIDRALEFAGWCGATRRVVVGGFCHADLVQHVRELAPDAVLVENVDFRKGNLISMTTGYAALEPGAGFLLMNVDHIYPRGVAEIVAGVAASASDVTAFCDFDRDLGADDMKVSLTSDQRVDDMSKQLARWDAGYVGMTFVPAARRAEYEAATEATSARDGERANVEAILVSMARAGQRPAIADISGHGWHEVDEPHERARAEAALRT
ncbi:MAG: NTP transferase domain-containing protein [Myxococcales bacterium]|nr:NTP transferase domain-containing protein [Myxococcales bacterium]